TLDRSPNQVKQADTEKTAADGAVAARLPETYQWLLAPTQETPQAPVKWQIIRVSGQDALAERASKKLKNDELLVVNFAASRLRNGYGPRAVMAREPRANPSARRRFRPLPLPAPFT